MLSSKTKVARALRREAPVTFYHFVENRTLVIDWASLAYHMFYSIASDQNREKYGLVDAEGEMELWRTKMVTRIIEYVALFNPRHLIFALEGKAAWRRKFVEDYYSEKAEIYWNQSEYYVVSDNFVYMVQKANGGGYAVTKLKAADREKLTELKHRKLGEMPEKQKRMFWDIYTVSGMPILPSYKGQRKYKKWQFFTDKKVWSAYREQFAMELAPLFRARAVQCIHAEGDDIVYASVRKFAGDSDDVIIVTRDSDMAQITTPNVRLFNHQTDTFINRDDPAKYLDRKVLMGDDSDNINGMAFVDTRKGKVGRFQSGKDTQISYGGANTLLEACPNIYETAKKYGWADQYMRNRTLIDLSLIPDEVSREIDAAFDLCPEPETPAGIERLDFWNIPGPIQSNYRNLQATGFYCVNSAKTSTKFDANMFARYRAAADRPQVDIGDSIITAENIGLDKELSDIDVIF